MAESAPSSTGAKIAVGNIYVPVIPVAKGFMKELADKITGKEGATTAGKKIGEQINEGVKKTLTLGKIVGLALTGYAAVKAGQGIGSLISRGMNRAVTLDTARAKLVGLKYGESAIAGITDSVSEAVQGTSFGLDEAMTISSTALAAGVGQGKDLTKYLSLITDVATQATAPLDEIGSIFNKIKSQNRLYAEEINQLGGRGIPIIQWLADEYGVAAEEMTSMVRKGEIDSAAFLRAVDKNLGGAAQTVGKLSYAGVKDNFFAAIGRVGEKGLAGGLGVAKTMMETATVWLKGLEKVSERVGASFWSWIGPKMIGGLKTALNFVGSIINNPATLNAGRLFIKLSEHFLSIATSMGIILAPIMDSIIRIAISFVTAIEPFLGTLANWMSKNTGLVTTLLEYALIAGAVFLGGKGIGAITSWGKVATQALFGVKGGVGGVIAAITKAGGVWGVVSASFAANPFVWIAATLLAFAEILFRLKTGMGIVDNFKNNFGIKGAVQTHDMARDIDFQNIPKLATGGNVTGATLAVIGEKKPETVTDLGLTNRTLAETQAMVAEARQNSIGNGTYNDYSTINVYAQDATGVVEAVNQFYTQRQTPAAAGKPQRGNIKR